MDALTPTGVTPTSTMPRVSAIVVNWNGGTMLDECLASLFAQTWPNLEILVVDNNSHDGSLALQMFFSPVRVVCMNTLRMALADASNSFYCRHTQGALDRIQAAREILGLATRFYRDWLGEARNLAPLRLPAPKMPLLLKAAFNQPDSIRMEDVYNPTKIEMQKVKELVEVDRKEFPKELHGTAWEAYNAVAKYTDYYREYRSEAKDARLRGVWFGTGAEIKKRAWDYLQTL